MPKDDPVYNKGKLMKHEQFEKRTICDKFVAEITNPTLRSLSPKSSSKKKVAKGNNVIANIITPQNKTRESQTDLGTNGYSLKS